MNIEFHGVMKGFYDTFQQSTADDLRHFMMPFNELGVTKWIIYSDYCIDDSSKLYNAVTFTIVPYVDDLDVLKAFIADIAPSDLKRTRTIDDRFGPFIKSGYLFNVAIVYEKGNNPVCGGATKEQLLSDLDTAIAAIRQWTANTPQNAPHFQEMIKRLTGLRQEMERKTFSLKLYRNIAMVHAMVAYLLAVLTELSGPKPEIIGWFSDRDSMGTAYGGVIYDLVEFNYHNICVAANLKDKEAQLAYAKQDLQAKQLWYDELIRIPNFLSGALAGRNYVSPQPDKYDQLFESAISDNPFLSVISFSSEDGGVRVRRISFTSSNPTDE